MADAAQHMVDQRPAKEEEQERPGNAREEAIDRGEMLRPGAQATSHQTSRTKPVASDAPEMRCAIDIIMVSIGR